MMTTLMNNRFVLNIFPERIAKAVVWAVFSFALLTSDAAVFSLAAQGANGTAKSRGTAAAQGTSQTQRLSENGGRSRSQENREAADSERPAETLRKSRPPKPTGEVADNHYPDGFLTVSAPSEAFSRGENVWAPAVDTPEPFRKDRLIFLLGSVVAVGLFLVVAWTDHLYRVRLQSVIAQNNRLLNGEDVDQFADNAPTIGIPLFLGTNQALTEDLTPALTDCLTEPLTEEISKIRE